MTVAKVFYFLLGHIEIMGRIAMIPVDLAHTILAAGNPAPNGQVIIGIRPMRAGQAKIRFLQMAFNRMAADSPFERLFIFNDTGLDLPWFFNKAIFVTVFALNKRRRLV